MKRCFWLVLIAFYLLPGVLFAGEALTAEDLTRLRSQRVIEHVLLESYLQTDKGLASVFGYHYDHFLTEHLYFALAIFGAVAGERGGYGIAAFGLGARWPLTDRLSLDVKGLAGSGGGGGLPAGGGFALQGLGGISYEFMDGLFFDLKGGYLAFPTGDFETPVVHFGISFESYRVILPW